MQACFREALRLYPVAPIIPRECVESTTVAGLKIPKGTSVHVNVFEMHHNPEYFPNPDAFRPERFLEAAALGNPDLHLAYTPFGQGPRNCIGYEFTSEYALAHTSASHQ